MSEDLNKEWEWIDSPVKDCKDAEERVIVLCQRDKKLSEGFIPVFTFLLNKIKSLEGELKKRKGSLL